MATTGLRTAVVLGTLPAPLEGGTGPHVTGWTILESLAVAGHQVSLGVWQRPNIGAKEQAELAERKQRILDLGVSVSFLPDVRVPRVGASRIRGLGAVRGALDLAR